MPGSEGRARCCRWWQDDRYCPPNWSRQRDRRRQRASHSRRYGRRWVAQMERCPGWEGAERRGAARMRGQSRRCRDRPRASASLELRLAQHRSRQSSRMRREVVRSCRRWDRWIKRLLTSASIGMQHLAALVRQGQRRQFDRHGDFDGHARRSIRRRRDKQRRRRESVARVKRRQRHIRLQIA